MNFIRAIIFSIICYYSLRFLGVASPPAYIASSIPLVLGTLNILTAYVYGTISILFILAATTPMLPQEYGGWINLLKSPLTNLDKASPSNHKMKNNEKN